MGIRATYTDLMDGEVDVTTGFFDVNAPTVRMSVDDHETEHVALMQYTPDQARELAAALLRAADEAEAGR